MLLMVLSHEINSRLSHERIKKCLVGICLQESDFPRVACLRFDEKVIASNPTLDSDRVSHGQIPIVQHQNCEE